MKSIQQVHSKAYSNIALVKYWGKTGRQYPLNPSLSLPIGQCFSSCTIDFKLDSQSPGLQSFQFEEKEHLEFKNRIKIYLDSVQDVFPLIKTTEMHIKTSNNFPHSAGIASSASAFAALALALVKIENFAQDKPQDHDTERSSLLARLASGSACRSVGHNDFAIWGESKWNSNTSNNYARFYDFDNSVKKQYGGALLDTVLVVDSSTKKVSSSEGHALMNTHPYKEARIEQAHENIRVLYAALTSGDLGVAGEIIENEALSLHAMMMTSYPSFTLLKPASLLLIEKIKTYREENNRHLYFTLDAGPNLHLIYPACEKEKIESFIRSDLAQDTESILWAQEPKNE